MVLLCPDLKELDIQIQGPIDLHDDVSSLHFVISRCDTAACAPESELRQFIDQTFVREYDVQDYMDFSTFVDPPLKTKLQKYDKFKLSPATRIHQQIQLQKHNYNTQDSYWPFGQTSQGVFYQGYSTVLQEYYSESEHQQLFRVRFRLMQEEVIHTRLVYGLLDVFGDLGGVSSVLVSLFGAILLPISEFSFILSLASKFYLAKTS